jgi:hypothetical protein
MLKTRTSLIAALAAGAVALTLAACGGSDDKGLSKAEFVKQAEAVCTDVNAKFKALGEPSDAKAVPAYVEKAVEITTDGTKRLQAIKAPEDLADGYAELIDLLDQQTAAVEKLGDAVEANDAKALGDVSKKGDDLNDRANAKARELGLDNCGEN